MNIQMRSVGNNFTLEIAATLPQLCFESVSFNVGLSLDSLQMCYGKHISNFAVIVSCSLAHENGSFQQCSTIDITRSLTGKLSLGVDSHVRCHIDTLAFCKFCYFASKVLQEICPFQTLLLLLKYWKLYPYENKMLNIMHLQYSLSPSPPACFVSTCGPFRNLCITDLGGLFQFGKEHFLFTLQVGFHEFLELWG